MKNHIMGIFFTLILLYSMIMPNILAENEPNIEWSKTYDEYWWWPNSVYQTTDEGYIIFGTSGEGLFLFKIDKEGNEQWNRTFGGTSYDHIGGFGLQTNDGGYALVGYTMTELLDEGDVWLIKTDENGIEQWNKTYGYANMLDSGNCIKQTSDGGYIIVGSTNAGGLLIKVASNGDLEWQKTFSKGEADMFFSVDQTDDEGYIITGYHRPVDSFDLWLVKTDKNGTKEWDKVYGGTKWDWGYSVEQTADGGYIVAGYTTLTGNRECWLIKTDTNGDEEWNEKLGGASNDEGKYVQQTNDGGYVIIGKTISFGGGGTDIWLVKTGSNGNEYWNMSFGDEGSEEGFFVQETSDGGYIVLGDDGFYPWLIKLGNDSYSPDESGIIDEDTQKENETEDTPGFELILAVCAIALVLILKKKK